MKKFKVPYTGFVYVNADTPDEAREEADLGGAIYEETEFGEPEEIDEFCVEF